MFLHRRDFVERRKVIESGDRVSFAMGADDRGRPCARDVAHLGYDGVLSLFQLLIAGALLFLPGLALLHLSPDWTVVGGYFAVINVLTVFLYIRDKHRARNQEWRIPEMQLHFLELLGGWPAGYLSQRLLRHKTSKTGYQAVFWLIVGLWQLAAYDLIRDGRWTRQAMAEVLRFLRG